MADTSDDFEHELTGVVTGEIDRQLRERSDVLDAMKSQMGKVLREFEDVTWNAHAKRSWMKAADKAAHDAGGPSAVHPVGTTTSNTASAASSSRLPKLSGAAMRGRKKHQLQLSAAAAAGGQPSDDARSPDGKIVFDKKLPRVAHIEKRVDGLQAILAAQHKHHMYERALVRFPQCRSNVFAPSAYDSDASATADATGASAALLPAPQSRLELDFVYGMQTGGTASSTSSASASTGAPANNGNSVHCVATGELLWFTAALVVLYDRVHNTQRFFREHTGAVTSVGVHPNTYIVASGQAARQTHVLVWNAKDEPLGERFTCLRGHAVAVRAISFSHDGKLIASLGGDLYNTICVHDWKEQTLLATARGHSFRVHTLAFNPFQACGRPETRRTKRPGQALHDDDACYTLVSCGVRHIRFWTLTRTEYVAPATEESADAAFYGSSFGSPARMRPATLHENVWKLEGNVPSFHGRFDVQDFTSLAFVDDSPPFYSYDAATQELVATNARDHTLGRILAGTAKGDVCVFYQPRKSPESTASSDSVEPSSLPNSSSALECEPAKWWEIPGEYSDAEINALVLERIAYEPTARLVELVPHDVETGNRFKLSKPAQLEIDAILKRLTLTPNAPALHARLQELKYSGAVGHSDVVTQLAYCRRNGLVMSCGSDGILLLWQCVLTRPVRVPGVTTLGLFTPLHTGTPSEGAHELVPVDHDTRRFALPTTLPGESSGAGSVASLPKPTSLTWRGDGKSVLVGTSSNCLWELTLASGTWTLVFEARSSAVTASTCHPTKDEVATVSHDGFVSVWDLQRHLCKRRAHVSAAVRATSLALQPFGDELALGTSAGELLVLEYTSLQVVKRKVVKSSSSSSSSTSAADLHALPASGIAQLKYCPLARFLAVGARDTVVYIYAASDRSYKRLLVCEGHASAISQLTWSADGALLQTNASDGELLYWNVAASAATSKGGSVGTAKQITDAFTVRDTHWVHWTCVFGWPTPGIWTEEATSLVDIAAVCTTNALNAVAPWTASSPNKQEDSSTTTSAPSSGQTPASPLTSSGVEHLLAVACKNSVRLFQWPAVRAAKAHSAAAHAAAIPSLAFSHSDAFLITVGGDDSTMIQWKVVRDSVSPAKPSPVARKRQQQQRLVGGGTSNNNNAATTTTMASGDASNVNEPTASPASSPSPPRRSERHNSGQRSPRQYARQYRERQEPISDHETDTDESGRVSRSIAAMDDRENDPPTDSVAAVSKAAQRRQERDRYEQVRATHDYVAEHPDELSFQRGELLRVLVCESDDWWRGERCDGTSGIFPVTFVELVHETNREADDRTEQATDADEESDQQATATAATDDASGMHDERKDDNSSADDSVVVIAPPMAHRDVAATLELNEYGEDA